MFVGIVAGPKYTCWICPRVTSPALPANVMPHLDHTDRIRDHDGLLHGPFQQEHTDTCGLEILDLARHYFDYDGQSPGWVRRG